uniref:Uncharacterized protein n=1 Tax=Arundo donax TaxID=35708 RepID=A0A0A9GDN5_ARUDO
MAVLSVLPSELSVMSVGYHLFIDLYLIAILNY